ncbi:Sec23/Sec24 family protein-like protein [Dothidotthia symphoricarpi CBS 119687]|uniref:Sec23/Sec24 family protein-like protein n=1 Tax=Dothidotthia symphoricarpi CBS 119687 TaxID=1392245 RepID=A0A6A6ARH5_9PLEO|nr:Sec23/Sec24 family protein-like protein [Dothidotthia symphoricarpi CBS 119687]KAF2134420.1 Sec23/Sec24 family protein-like protein [Dothidotthia symphoricarpi CBS 119687]
MSEYPVYNAFGQGSPNPNGPPKRKDDPTRWRPPVAASPGGYQQTGTPVLGQGPNQHLGTPAQQPASLQPESYFPQQPPLLRQQSSYQDVNNLASQMGAVGLRGDNASAQPRPKKKDRHAYHQIEGPGGSPMAFNGTPQLGTPTQYFGQGSPQVGGPQWVEPEITPAMSQFPAATPIFNPGSQASPMQHAARSPGTPLVGAAASSAQGRVDPEQIPSVARSRDAPAKYYLEHIYPTMEHHLPPPATVPYVAFDQGNSSPKYARLTLNSIPVSAEALAATALPLGLVLQPLAALQEGEQPVPVLDFGETGPPRCRRCRAYINPFMQFKAGGNKFVCNMCNFPNDVPGEYFSPTDQTGVRVDRLQRPELMLGTVDFMVPKEYWSKEPVGLRWLFLIDVTAEAVNRGFLAAFCEGIVSALYGGSNDSSEETDSTTRIPKGAKVGIMTFDKSIHFYNLSSKLSAAQMLVMPDIEDPFLPFSEGVFVDPVESKAVITSLLTQLPGMFSEHKNPEPALLPTLDSAVAALSATGGKIVCSLSALPTWGPGRLILRDDGNMHSTDAEKKLLTTEHPGFRKTAEKMVQGGIGVDFFMAAPSGGYLDVATIGHISATTGGEVFYYPNFHSPRDTLKLSKEITHTVMRETGYQALMKVRCSNGLQVSAYHGNFYHHTFGADLEFGVIDADKAIGVMFSYDGKLDPKLDAHFQSALLYTTASGERRVRCSNIVASIGQNAGECMKFVDQDAVVNIIAKEAAARMTEKNLKEIRGALTEKTVDILAGYRKNFTGNNPPGQLVLPENLKEFSMYILGLIKSRAFKAGKEPTDRRVHDMRMIKSMGALELSLYLYPRIISIHNLDERDGFANENGHLRMPESVRASFAKIEEGGAYLIDNGQVCLLWLHSQVSPNLLEDLFGPEQNSLKTLDPFQSTLPVLETHLNAQVRNMLHYLEGTRGSKALTIQLARQGLDGAEYEFARLLYEDRNNEAQSYVDWLVYVHRHIQLELAGQRKKDDSDSVGSSFVGLRTPYW